jgi:hypothetical protein
MLYVTQTALTLVLLVSTVRNVSAYLTYHLVAPSLHLFQGPHYLFPPFDRYVSSTKASAPDESHLKYISGLSLLAVTPGYRTAYDLYEASFGLTLALDPSSNPALPYTRPALGEYTTCIIVFTATSIVISVVCNGVSRRTVL